MDLSAKLIPVQGEEFVPIEMTFLSYLVVKLKFEEYRQMSTIISRGALKYSIFFGYFVSLIFVRSYQKQHALIDVETISLVSVPTYL